jgi:hypothetical protein
LAFATGYRDLGNSIDESPNQLTNLALQTRLGLLGVASSCLNLMRPGAHDQLSTIYRKNCTIQLPFLRAKDICPDALLSSSSEDYDLYQSLKKLIGETEDHEVSEL